MLLSEAITAVRTEGGFDTSSTGSSDAQIRSWVWQAVSEALGESKWRKQRRELGPTVAGESQYALPDEVVEVYALRVGGGRPWALAPSVTDLWEAEAGNAWLSNAPGAFLGTVEPDADSVLELWPVPETSGDTIEALVAVLPTTSDDGNTVLPLPADLARPIAVNGAVEIGLALLEQRHDDAAAHGAKKKEAVATLKRRANSRVGAGPHQIPIRQP